MDEKRSLLEQAADALRQAMSARTVREQSQLIEEALRLNRLALAQEKAELLKLNGRGPTEP